MTIYFGLELDDMSYLRPHESRTGVHIFGEQDLLLFLESHLGLIGHPTNNQYLRIEQYRQVLARFLETYDDAFFKKSYEADQLATAAALLERRDTLVLEGWNFAIEGDIPERLAVFALMEELIQRGRAGDETGTNLAAGYADRFRAVVEALEHRSHPIEIILHNEPFDLLPPHIVFLFEKLRQKGVKVQPTAPFISSETPSSDLQKWQYALQHKSLKQSLAADGSLLIIKGKRETELASYLAQLCRHNPDFRPLCVIPEKNRALENAFIQEGQPGFGILSASSARPSLQILKLVTAFVWRPFDPYKILEFVSLAVKPLHDELARRIAQQIARTPGMNGDGWYATIARFFEELEERAKTDSRIDVAKTRFQYRFWFERNRFDVSRTVPKEEVIQIFDYLAQWAFEEFEDSGSTNSSLIVLSEQAKRIQDLLETLPDAQGELTALELERIVRTIYEPSPVVLNERALGHLPYVYRPSAVLEPADKVLWWNFIHNEQGHFFSDWYADELTFLEKNKVYIQSPTSKNQCALWQRKRAILAAQKQLILVLPNMVNGTEVQAHPLFGDLQAAFDTIAPIIFDITTEEGKGLLEKMFRLPQKKAIQHRQLGHPKPFLHVNSTNLIERAYETFTSLESLFYYPYQWVFRYKIKLVKSSILSIVPDVTLMGNLAHRFFERLFQEEDISDWTQEQVGTWIDSQAPRLFAREGATLLLYGREPERLSFLGRVKYAAWSLVYMMQQNGWQVKATEMDLQGHFSETPIRAKADLVLQKDDKLAVIDLKWRGAARRKRIIKNEEDLQLTMYARLLTADDATAETAYFIIEDGQMIARNSLAFAQAVAVTPDQNALEAQERMWQKMLRTYEWRRQQLQEGVVEIRTESTLPDLEDAYAGTLFDVLEMKDKDAPFDDYRTLINLVE